MATRTRRAKAQPAPAPALTADPDAVSDYVPPAPPGFHVQQPEPVNFTDETLTGQYGHQQEAVGLMDTATQQPERLDADLAGLDNAEHRRRLYDQLRVTPMARRSPDDVMLVWVGFHKGVRTETVIALNVPDTTNDDRAWELISMVEAGHPAQQFTGHQTHRAPDGSWYPQGLPINNRGTARDQVVTPDNLHIKGPTYTFELGKSTPVAAQDVPFFLAHPVVVIKVSRDEHVTPMTPGRALLNDIRGMSHQERLEFFRELGLVQQSA